jgi:ribonuclease P protein component
MIFSLKSREILRKQNDIKAIFSKNNKVTGEYVTIFFKFGKSKKAAFIVSKKIDKRAVVRNKIKRWLREIYRNRKINLHSNVEMLIVAKHNILNTEYTLLNEEIEKLFNNINYINN